MVSAGKVFKLREELDLSTAATKLSGYRKEEPFEEEQASFNLITEIHSLAFREDGSLSGVFSKDIVFHVLHHGNLVPVPKTLEAPFVFAKRGDSLLLFVVEKKERANNIANLLSEILFITAGSIVEARIDPNVLRNFHERNIEGTKVVFFEDVDIPNINKLSLYGSSLSNTSLYIDYLSHGKIWYAVMTSKKYGYIVGLTRTAIVTIFGNIGLPEFITYVADEIFPLIS
jgi:hypothetical protein